MPFAPEMPVRFGAIKRRLKVVDMFTQPNGTTLDRIPFHALRHTFVTAMQSAGVAKELREVIVGHATGDVQTEVYTHYDVAGLVKTVKKVSYGEIDKLVRKP